MLKSTSDFVYDNDSKLRNGIYGPMDNTIGIICVFNGHEIYNNVVIRRQSNPPFNNPADRVMNSRMSGQCSHAIHVSEHSVVSNIPVGVIVSVHFSMFHIV